MSLDTTIEASAEEKAVSQTFVEMLHCEVDSLDTFLHATGGTQRVRDVQYNILTLLMEVPRERASELSTAMTIFISAMLRGVTRWSS